MADIKLSQLGQITTLDDDDLMLVSQEQGGIFTSKSIKVSDLATEILSNINDNDNGTPVGIIQMWSLNISPSDYLECNGAAVSRITFSDLFMVIGSTYGNGNGSTTFNLPDYRGEFLRGWDNGKSSDPDSGSRTDRGDGTAGDNNGTKQDNELESHTHSIQQRTVFNNSGSGSAAGNGDGNWGTASTGGNETRPRNINIMYIIKT